MFRKYRCIVVLPFISAEWLFYTSFSPSACWVRRLFVESVHHPCTVAVIVSNTIVVWPQLIHVTVQNPMHITHSNNQRPHSIVKHVLIQVYTWASWPCSPGLHLIAVSTGCSISVVVSSRYGKAPDYSLAFVWASGSLRHQRMPWQTLRFLSSFLRTEGLL